MKSLRPFSFVVTYIFALFVVLGFPTSAFAAPIYNETFGGSNGTSLENWNNAWTKNTGNPSLVLDGSGIASVAGEAHYDWGGTYTSAQAVQMDVQIHRASGRNYYGIMLRDNGGGGGNNNEQVYFEINSDYSATIWNSQSSTKASFPASTFTEGDWHTIKVTYDNNDTVTVYLDGIQKAQWTSASTTYATGAFSMSVDNGSIRNFKYGGYYTVYSETFGGGNGTYLENWNNAWTKNTGNPSLVLDGSGIASVAGETHYQWSGPYTSAQAVQVDVQIHRAAGRNYYGIMLRDNGGTGGNNNEQVYFEINSDYSATIWNSQSSTKASFPASTFTEGDWHTLKATYDDNDTLTVYLDGIQKAQWASPSTTYATGAFSMSVDNGSIRNFSYSGDTGL
jgi:hypothetical protein